jgi:hypothetical protein
MGIETIFSLVILLICIILLVLFAGFCNLIFQDEKISTKKTTFYDTLRIALGIGFMGFTIFAGSVAFSITDLSLKMAAIGIEIGVFGIGLSMIFGVLSDRRMNDRREK